MSASPGPDHFGDQRLTVPGRDGSSRPTEGRRFQRPDIGGWRSWILPLAMAGLTLVFIHVSRPNATKTLTYSTFVNDVTSNHVTSATITATGQVTGLLTGGSHYASTLPTALGNSTLSALLLSHKVAITALPPSTGTFGSLLLSFLPFLLIVGFYLWFARRQRGGAGAIGGGPLSAIMSIGKSKAKVYDEDRPTTRFADIAGYTSTKEEVMEVVDFLKNPAPYARAGAIGPKGLLMVGPPGTGKTLMARAVAGEAGVPFFALSGSSFVEMFVGVGASRVRSLFEDARKRSPSIIFIDEIDAIGGRRGPGGFGTNDEREQTLNQLLSEMDGFEPGSNVVVIAATNRVEILDPALLRPGRFDRTVEIPLPDQRERTQILSIHGKGKTLNRDVDLDAISRATPGFSGADLANLVNEAAIQAVRGHRSALCGADFDAARDRLLLGHRGSTSALLPAEKDAVAIHEAGHALVAILSQHADPVAKVTILPRGAALGITEQLPLFERHLYSMSHLTDSLAVRMGGRAAELLMLGEASTGAASDLVSATELATRMVREWGLSSALGPIGYTAGGPSRDNPFAGEPYSEQTQRVIDEEVANLLRAAETTATKLLTHNRPALEKVIQLLLERETINGHELAQATGVPQRGAEPQRPHAAVLADTAVASPQAEPPR